MRSDEERLLMQQNKVRVLEEKFSSICRAYKSNQEVQLQQQHTIAALNQHVLVLQNQLQKAQLLTHKHNNTQTTEQFTSKETCSTSLTPINLISFPPSLTYNTTQIHNTSNALVSPKTNFSPAAMQPGRKSSTVIRLNRPHSEQLLDDQKQQIGREGGEELLEIWEERDRELCKMDQLFECLRHRLKQYQ